MKEIIYLIGLHSIGFTHPKFHLIFAKKQNYKEVFENISFNTLKKYRFSDKQISSILEKKEKINLDYLQNIINRRKVKIITYYEQNYPETLKQISNKPFLIYLRGRLPKLNCIAVVGSRKITPYGVSAIEKIIPTLANKFCIVSGGAAGCDSEAHKASLDSIGKTLSVIGTGIDLDYPVSGSILYNSIVEKGGGVISIFPIGTPGNPFNFPVRNEIVAGISVGTLIVEAEEKSGSLITGKLALDLGKDLFAIPGEIFKPRSAGCNKLISAGEAKLITKASDILLEYGFNNAEIKTKVNIKFNDKLEEEIYNLLSLGALGVDQILKKLKQDLSLLNLKLSMLELGGIIKKSRLGKYKLV